MVYYTKTNHVFPLNGYNNALYYEFLPDPTHRWTNRLRAYSANVSFAKDPHLKKINQIPLFSNEYTSCFYDGQGSEDFLGNWLGANIANQQNYKTAEESYFHYYSQIDQGWNPACTTCKPNIVNRAAAWFKFGCMDGNGGNYIGGMGNSSCDPTISIDELDFNPVLDIKVFPNPVSDILTIDLEHTNESNTNYQYTITDVLGKAIKRASLVWKFN